MEKKTLEIIEISKKKGIDLWLEGKELHCKTPPSDLSSEFKSELLKNKENIIKYLLSQNRSESALHQGNINYFPLTPAQKRLWFLWHVGEGGNVYNIVNAYTIRGELDVAAFSKSVSQVLKEHDSLRINFKIINNEPYQFIRELTSISFSNEKITTPYSFSEKENFINETITNEFKHKFDLEKELLVRLRLIQFDNDYFVFILNMHHIISDGWSIGIFLNEIEKFYAFNLENLDVLEVKTADYNYIDYSIYCNNYRNKSSCESFWLDNYKEIPSPSILPADFDDQNCISDTGLYESILINEDLLNRIKIFCKDRNCSIFMFLLAAFKILLYRHSLSSNINIGFPIANRRKIEFEKIIGLFVNTLMVRTELTSDIPFVELVKKIRNFVLGAFENQDYPFEKLVEKLNPSRDTDSTPLFRTWFNFINTDEVVFNLKKLEVNPIEFKNIPTKFLLSYYAEEYRNSIKINLIYKPEFYSSKTILEYLKQYMSLLNQIIDIPELRISEYCLSTPFSINLLPNLNCIISEANKLTPLNLLLANTPIRVAQNVAIVDSNTLLTFELLEKISNQVANYLIEFGIKKGDTVILHSNKSIELVVFVLALVKCGAIFCLIDSLEPESYKYYKIKSTSPSAVIDISNGNGFSQNSILQLKKDNADYVIFEDFKNIEEKVKNHSAENPDIQIDIDDIMYRSFTSGTTGSPKVVSVSHKSIAHFFKYYLKEFDFNSEDNFSLLSGIGHDPILRDIFVPLLVGGTLYIPPKNVIYSNELAKWLKISRITVCHLTPSIARLIVLNPENLDTLRYVFMGGEKLYKQDISNFTSLASNATYFNCYGTTETPQIMSCYKIPNLKSEKFRKLKPSIPIGKGIDGVELHIINKFSLKTGIGEIGEIYIRTPYLSNGYDNDLGETAKKFLNNPFLYNPQDKLYRTGDYGRYNIDGDIEILNRIDNQLNIRGFRIETDYIKNIMNGIDDIVNSEIIYDYATDKLFAFYVGVSRLSTLNIKRELRKKIPEYIIPDKLIQIENIPVTTNNKVDFARLRKFISIQDSVNEVRKLPMGGNENYIAQKWKELINTEKIYATDNFFDIGGNSFLAVKFVLQINKDFNKKLTFRDIINCNLQEISKKITV